MSVFCPIGGHQHRFRLDHPLVSVDNPPADKEIVASGNVQAKTNPEFRQCFSSSSDYGLGHRFIENRADHASMNDSVEAFPDGCRSPSINEVGALFFSERRRGRYSRNFATGVSKMRLAG